MSGKQDLVDAQISQILEIIDTIFFALDRDWQVAFVNQAAERFLEKARDQLLGRSIWDVLPEELGALHRDVYRAAASERATNGFVAFCPSTDRWFVARLHPSNDLLAVCFFDITEPKRLEEALRKSRDELERRVAERTADLAAANEELAKDIAERAQVEGELVRLRKAVEASGEIVFLTDRDGTINFVNPEFTRVYGYAADEVVGKTTPRVLKSGLASWKQYEVFWKTLLAGQTLQGEFTNKTKDGRLLNIEGSANPIAEERNGIVGFLAVQRDATERKRVERALQETVERLRRTLEGTIQAMALTVEMRDPYTAGHQRRVAELACAIAREMGLSDEQTAVVRFAGMAHDIGKIAVPADILSKPGRINDVEFQLIQAHPQVASRVLKTIEFPWPIAEIVLQHHERLDGSGYPAHLRDDKILLEARILAVADVVEAMASHRPYRAAIGVGGALEEISRNKGLLYDADVVDACLRAFTEKSFEWS